ncbi:MAG: hypothetical protein WBE82_21995 [Xanthobacteraceae bacterium]
MVIDICTASSARAGALPAAKTKIVPIINAGTIRRATIPIRAGPTSDALFAIATARFLRLEMMRKELGNIALFVNPKAEH